MFLSPWCCYNSTALPSGKIKRISTFKFSWQSVSHCYPAYIDYAITAKLKVFFSPHHSEENQIHIFPEYFLVVEVNM